MPYCVVVNCQSDSKNKTQEKDYQWFKLPDESTLQSKCFRKRWLEVINRNFKPSRPNDPNPRGQVSNAGFNPNAGQCFSLFKKGSL